MKNEEEKLHFFIFQSIAALGYQTDVTVRCHNLRSILSFSCSLIWNPGAQHSVILVFNFLLSPFKIFRHPVQNSAILLIIFRHPTAEYLAILFAQYSANHL
jgi:hypothetical protein